MRVVIFGASGFLGSHVCEQFCLAGHEVTAVIRDTSDRSFLETLPCKISISDFSESNILHIVKNADCVVNCLANPTLHLPETERRKVDVQLTTIIFNCCKKVDVKRFIQLSTVQVYGFSRPPEAINEDFPQEATHPFNRVMIEREMSLKTAALKSSTELIFVRPVNCTGKRDVEFLPNLISAHKKGIFATFGNGKNKFSCIDARDVGAAFVFLAEKEQLDDDTFLVGAYDLSWLDLKAALDKFFNKKSRHIKLPVSLMKCIAQLLEKITPYSKNLALHPFAVSVLSTQTLFDDSRIRRLGFNPRYTLQDSIKELVEP